MQLRSCLQLRPYESSTIKKLKSTNKVKAYQILEVLECMGQLVDLSLAPTGHGRQELPHFAHPVLVGQRGEVSADARAH